MVELGRAAARLRRLFLRYRRLVIAALAALTVVTAVEVVSPPPAPTAPLVVASHDLPAGEEIQAGDVRLVQVSPALVPTAADSSVSQAIGEVLAAPMRAGEALTDRRVVGTALVAGYSAQVVATPVRIQDADVVSLLRVGDHIDVYAATGDMAAPARRVVTGAPVITLPSVHADGREGALVVLAVDDDAAAALAQAGATTQLSVSLRR